MFKRDKDLVRNLEREERESEDDDEYRDTG
jgi:hypothetical protein